MTTTTTALDITTATVEDLHAELDRVCEEGVEASELYAFLDPFTTEGRKAERALCQLKMRRNEIVSEIRARRAATK